MLLGPSSRGHYPSALISPEPGTRQLGATPIGQGPVKLFKLANPKHVYPAHLAWQWRLSPRLPPAPCTSWLALVPLCGPAWHAAPAVPRGLWGWTSTFVAVISMSVCLPTLIKINSGCILQLDMFYPIVSIVSNSRGSKFALWNTSTISLCWDSVAPRLAVGCQATPSGCLLRCLFYILKMYSGPISSSFTPH